MWTGFNQLRIQLSVADLSTWHKKETIPSSAVPNVFSIIRNQFLMYFQSYEKCDKLWIDHIHKATLNK
jgi:hypothetical protein